MSYSFQRTKASIFSVFILCFSCALAAAEETPQPRTTSDPQVLLDELKLLLKPLTKAQLLVEADAWQALLEYKANEIATLEIQVKRGNRIIEQAQEAGDLTRQAAEKLAKAQEQVVTDGGLDDEEAKAAATARAKLEQGLDQLEAMDEVGQIVEVARDEAVSLVEKSELLQQAADTADRQQAAGKEAKVGLLEQVASLREQRTALADRLEAVLDALERKTDKGDSDTLAKIQDFRLYSQAVGGLVVDVEDTTSALIAVKGWATSPEGGVRWAFNIAKCLGILFVAWMISRFVSGGIRHALSRVDGTSRLLENFLVNAARWIVMAIGLIMALAALEISIGPMLALLGAAGFVIAFALQDSLSNFASGLMILFFRPFDEGDGIDAGGVAGKVQSMNLVSTTILTFDNKRMIVPNNKIWNDVITNITGVRERRVDMQFSIGYDDDIDAASAILEDIISAHPKVLKDPEPTIRLHALADSSVNFIVRPWALTEDYWDVNWDVTRAVKKRFDAAGIGIPFPQRDVHLYLEGGRQLAEITPAPEKKYSAKTGPSVREDGGLDDAADGSAGEDGET